MGADRPADAVGAEPVVADAGGLQACALKLTYCLDVGRETGAGGREWLEAGADDLDDEVSRLRREIGGGTASSASPSE